jgi:uncharacterized membrane protein
MRLFAAMVAVVSLITSGALMASHFPWNVIPAVIGGSIVGILAAPEN